MDEFSFNNNDDDDDDHNKNLGPRELSSQVMQNIYSPSGFYLISPHDNSRTLIKSQDIYKKNYIYAFI